MPIIVHDQETAKEFLARLWPAWSRHCPIRLRTIVPCVAAAAAIAVQHEDHIEVDEDGGITITYDDGSWEYRPLLERQLCA